MAQKNTHLTHVEDRILIDGKKAQMKPLRSSKEMGKFLSGSPGPGVSVTTKWDGAQQLSVGLILQTVSSLLELSLSLLRQNLKSVRLHKMISIVV